MLKPQPISSVKIAAFREDMVRDFALRSAAIDILILEMNARVEVLRAHHPASRIPDLLNSSRVAAASRKSSPG